MISSKMKFLILFFFAGFLWIGCSSLPAATVTAAPTEPIRAQAATSTSEVMQLPLPSPTDIQLPFNSNSENNGYCKPPYAVLPVGDGNDISEDEIVYELIRMWLRRYKQDAAPPFCRIVDYSIDKVYNDPAIYSKVLEPRGDFKRVVVFSVKLIEAPSDWMGFTGELDPENWLQISHIVAVTKTGEGYTLEFAYP